MTEKKLLHSKIIGDGRPLIILHGLLGMGDNWISFARKMADQGFQVHLIDQRNHGRSFHEDEINYEVMVEDLKNYMDFHQINQADILGHSMGGKTAMFFALKHPEKVNKLVVVDISPKYYPPHHSFIFEAIKSVPLHLTSRKEIEKIIDEKIQNKAITGFILKNLKREKNKGFTWKPNMEILENSLEELGEALPPLSIIDKPVLFIKGEKSPYISQADFPLIKAHFPQALIKTIPRSGHWVHAEQPLIFNEEISDFLKKS